MRIAIIDPVGAKMGMNHYNDGLMGALAVNGFEPYIFSNYISESKGVTSKVFFNNIRKSWLLSAVINFTGVIKSVLFCKRKKINRIIFHIFKGGLFDFFALSLMKTCNLKITLIVHDIETIDTNTNRFFKRFVIRRFHQSIVVHNRFSADELKKFIGNPYASGIFVIPHGNYLHTIKHTYSRAESMFHFGLDPNEKYLLFFGQIKKSKGLDVLLHAMPLVKNNFKLIIAGKLRIKNFDTYNEIIRSHKLADRILLKLEHIPENDMQQLFALSEAVVLPYQLIYQSGVLLLAMSHEKCVIASDLAPFKEVITDKGNGLLFKRNDPEDLALKIDELLSEDFNASIAGFLAKETMEKNYGWQTIAKEFDRILKMDTVI